MINFYSHDRTLSFSDHSPIVAHFELLPISGVAKSRTLSSFYANLTYDFEILQPVTAVLELTNKNNFQLSYCITQKLWFLHFSEFSGIIDGKSSKKILVTFDFLLICLISKSSLAKLMSRNFYNIKHKFNINFRYNDKKFCQDIGKVGIKLNNFEKLKQAVCDLPLDWPLNVNLDLNRSIPPYEYFFRTCLKDITVFIRDYANRPSKSCEALYFADGSYREVFFKASLNWMKSLLSNSRPVKDSCRKATLYFMKKAAKSISDSYKLTSSKFYADTISARRLRDHLVNDLANMKKQKLLR